MSPRDGWSAHAVNQARASGNFWTGDETGTRRSTVPDRAADERLLTWLAMRSRGSSTTAIATRYGVSEMTVRVATNRVRFDDKQAADFDPAAYWPSRA